VCWSMGRGNGKTGLAAMLALCHLVGPEAEPRGEVYAAANDKFQAGRLFNEIAAIVEKVPWLAARVSIRRHVKELEDIGGTGSMFAALSADVPTKHLLVTEFHRVRRAWPIAVARSPGRIADRPRQARESDAVDHLDAGGDRRDADEPGHRLRLAHPARRACRSDVSLGPVRGAPGRRSLEARDPAPGQPPAARPS